MAPEMPRARQPPRMSGGDRGRSRDSDASRWRFDCASDRPDGSGITDRSNRAFSVEEGWRSLRLAPQVFVPSSCVIAAGAPLSRDRIRP